MAYAYQEKREKYQLLFRSAYSQALAAGDFGGGARNTDRHEDGSPRAAGGVDWPVGVAQEFARDDDEVAGRCAGCARPAPVGDHADAP